jgi:hypothetical protein
MSFENCKTLGISQLWPNSLVWFRSVPERPHTALLETVEPLRGGPQGDRKWGHRACLPREYYRPAPSCLFLCFPLLPCWDRFLPVWCAALPQSQSHRVRWPENQPADRSSSSGDFVTSWEGWWPGCIRKNTIGWHSPPGLGCPDNQNALAGGTGHPYLSWSWALLVPPVGDSCCNIQVSLSLTAAHLLSIY